MDQTKLKIYYQESHYCESFLLVLIMNSLKLKVSEELVIAI